jgi:PAS domain S-box-containing protein
LWVSGISPKLARRNFPKIPLANTEDVAIKCLTEKKMVNVSDVKANSSVHDDIKTLAAGVSFILMPLIVDDSAIGLVGFVNNVSKHGIETETIQRYQRFVDTLAMFFNNSMIYAELELLKQGLERQIEERTADLKQAHETIWEVNENLSAIIENSTIGIIATDPGGVIRVFNRSAGEILGTRLGLLPEPRITAIISPELMGRLSESNAVETPDTNVLCRNFETELSRGDWSSDDAGLVPVSLSAVRLKSREGIVSGYVYVFQDIREVRFLETKLIHAEKLKMIGQMAAGISHELNTPLAMIKASAAVIKQAENEHKGEMVAKHLGFINESVSRASSFVQDFLKLAKPTITHFQKAEIAGVISKAIELFRLKSHTRKTDFIKSVEEGMPPVYCDVNKLIQVFINLFDNAVDAMGGSGEIAVKVFCRELLPADVLSEDHLKRRADDPPRSILMNYRKFHLHDLSKLPPVFEAGARIIQIEVTDSGLGMSHGLIEHVFDPFFSTKAGNGNGLGLTISQSIIKEHKGCIALSSIPDKGTTATIKLPTYQTMTRFERMA